MGNSLPAGRCGPGRGQERERAQCCPVFVCCLRMHSDGGMDHLGEAAGSRGAAALHYDREVRAPSWPSGGPRDSHLTSRPSPSCPQPILCPFLSSSVHAPLLPALRDYRMPSDAPLLQLLLLSAPPSLLYEAPLGGGSLSSQRKRSCWLSRGPPTLRSQSQSPSGSLNRIYKESRIVFGQRRANGKTDLLFGADVCFPDKYLLN